MILYLDTSALAKLFVSEPGSEAVRRGLGQATDCYTHVIAYAEIRAALAKALRMGRETPELLDVHKQELEGLWNALGIVTPDEPMIRRAGDLAELFGLRAYDSVHLAAAEAIGRRVGGGVEFRFAVSDRRLSAAARSLGLHPLEEA